MKYKILDCINNEYLDLTKYCVNGFGDIMTTKGIVLQNQDDFKIEEQNEEALREIDTHIRSTNEPISYIIETLEKILPEYKL